MKNSITDRIDRLRDLMKKERIDVYYIPSDDFHGSEFVSDYFKEREYISGFTGSAGTVIVSMDEAVLYTDGRYFLQAEKELEGSGIKLYRDGNKNVPKINQYLCEILDDGMTLAFDGRCMTTNKVFQMKSYFLRNNKNIIINGSVDLPGIMWEDRPELPDEKGFVLKEEYAGESLKSKILKIREFMYSKSADIFILTSLDDIAWTLNIRGGDVKCSPLVLSYLIVSMDDICFYCGSGKKEDRKLAGIYDYLVDNGICVKGYFDIYEDLKGFEKEVILADLSKVNYKIYSMIERLQINDVYNPTTILKAVKNDTEIKNMRDAHIKDAVASIKFLYWFKNRSLNQKITELDLCENMLENRSSMDGFISESFEPIVAYGKHGAIVHYSPDENTNAEIENKSFVLIDTGAHYIEGTTDITRTISCGELTEEEKRNYTLVLKGNLALGNAVFMEGATGASLDMLARKPLWDNYMDYNHGTGHGVGYLLNVHEGPNAIRYKVSSVINTPAFKEGMITSNEPGLYLTDKYGIRTENMILCVNKAENEFGKFLGFETLTLVPFETEAIVLNMLNEEERELINSYHERIYTTLHKYFDGNELKFLESITKRI